MWCNTCCVPEGWQSLCYYSASRGWCPQFYIVTRLAFAIASVFADTHLYFLSLHCIVLSFFCGLLLYQSGSAYLIRSWHLSWSSEGPFWKFFSAFFMNTCFPSVSLILISETLIAIVIKNDWLLWSKMHYKNYI